MQQGHSGSSVRRVHDQVEKQTADRAFAADAARQADLIALSRQLAILPRIERIDGALITMAFIDGSEGLTAQNAARAGAALRTLHDRPDFPHLCHTGVTWLIALANETLRRANQPQRVSPGLVRRYPADALIHSEPVQLKETPDGRIVFVDFEGIGRGSRYQDLGFVEYIATLTEQPDVGASFIAGYLRSPLELDPRRIQQLAGLIALAYANFAETEQRLALGLQLLAAVEPDLAGDVWIDA